MLAPPSGQRGTPYAPVAALNTRPCDSVRLGACRRPPAGSPPNGPGSLFKSGDCGLVLRVMARAGRELAVVHGPQLPAQRLLSAELGGIKVTAERDGNSHGDLQTGDRHRESYLCPPGNPPHESAKLRLGMTHPYLAHVWAKKGADLRVPVPGQSAKVAMLGVLDWARRKLIVRTSRTKR